MGIDDENKYNCSLQFGIFNPSLSFRNNQSKKDEMS